MTVPRTLVLGWGNPARGDDGLGQALTALLEDSAGLQEAARLTIESDYQLHIEDAADLASHDRVVFVDADRDGSEPFSCRRIMPEETGLSFTSHSISPGALLALTRDLFRHEPEAWIVGIRGYDFESFEESLSPNAEANLTAAASFLRSALRDRHLHEFPSTSSETAPRVCHAPNREDIQ